MNICGGPPPEVASGSWYGRAALRLQEVRKRTPFRGSRHALRKGNAMGIKLKKLADQVIVITGASSGIGLATAEAAAKQGAKLVLAARSEQALNKIVRRLTGPGAEAIAVPCDVADRRQVEKVAGAAVARFGRI